MPLAGLYLLYLGRTNPEKIHGLEETPVEELIQHPEELSPNVRREDVQKKEREKKAAQDGSGTGESIQLPEGTGGNGAPGESGSPSTESEKNADVAEPEQGTVHAYYYLNGQRVGAWTDVYDYPMNNWQAIVNIPAGQWKTWSGDDQVRQFPDGWSAHVHVVNTTQITYPTPYLLATYSSGSEHQTETYPSSALLPGGSIDFDVPLGGYPITNPMDGRNPRKLYLEIKGIDVFTTYSVRMNFEFYPQPQ